ncbi:MAG: hypothetical protein INQ03_01550 [Candidatus Heimdallarchaeota archaeon]|nr:hypothetical protein [Candidatus Heimdallarchaeota archaeon]
MDNDQVIADIMINLIETAHRDGYLSEDEKAILDSIENSLAFYKQALDDATEDGKITKAEHEHLQKIKDIVINAATLVAERSDNEITSEEMNLLIGAMVSIKVPKATE